MKTHALSGAEPGKLLQTFHLCRTDAFITQRRLFASSVAPRSTNNLLLYDIDQSNELYGDRTNIY